MHCSQMDKPNHHGISEQASNPLHNRIDNLSGLGLRFSFQPRESGLRSDICGKVYYALNHSPTSAVDFDKPFI